MITGERMDSFMRTKTFCCCIPPRTGIQIMAVLTIVGSIWNLNKSMMDLYSGHYIPEQSFGMGENFFKSVKILQTIMCIVTIILESLLIKGVQQNKPSLIFPSVCVHFIAICLFIPLVFLPIVRPGPDRGFAVIIFIQLLLFLSFLVHWTFVLYHYYRDLVRSQNSEHPPQQIQYNSRRV